MSKRWWQTGWLWAGLATGLFFAILAFGAGHVLHWPIRTRVGACLAAFVAGAAVEWLHLGIRGLATAGLLAGLFVVAWNAVPESKRDLGIDWLAPVRTISRWVDTAAPEEGLDVPGLDLDVAPGPEGLPTTRPRTRASEVRTARSGPGTTAPASHPDNADRPVLGRIGTPPESAGIPVDQAILEVQNADGYAMDVGYRVGLFFYRPLGRVEPGETARFTFTTGAADSVFLRATDASGLGHAQIVVKVAVQPGAATHVSLRL